MKDDYFQSGRVKQKLGTRNQILRGTQELLKEGKEITLEDVAKKAGVSRATIYRYYSNKEVLAMEAGLDLSTKAPETLMEGYQNLDLEQSLLEIQEYYNTLTVTHENAFRKYLGAILSSNSVEKRGARRVKTLNLALKSSSLSSKEKEDLANLLTVLMGIEPMIVTKDVAGLSNKKSKELLRWGVELILKGFKAEKAEVG